MHYNSPRFIGAGKHIFPSWLLVIMARSGLYDDIFIHQTQGLSYLHSWKDYDKTKGGFYFYPQGVGGDIQEVDAVPN